MGPEGPVGPHLLRNEGIACRERLLLIDTLMTSARVGPPRMDPADLVKKETPAG